jgi:hypothetical protein
MKLRQSQGLSVMLIDVEDVYDEFSYGNKTPQAIKDFLRYAATSWKRRPQFVLLAGDGSYDPHNYLGHGDKDQVPTRLLDTALMEAASDDWFGDIDGDGIPELAIGRLPARTAEEAALLVTKTIGYEQAASSDEVLLVADANEGFDFEAASKALGQSIPSYLRIGHINRGREEAAQAKAELFEAIARGQRIVNYSGHGSLDTWRGGLLTTDEARGLTNGDRLPLFVMMTCLNGFFDDPASESLGESLLKAPRGGAVAVWASSGMTMPAEQSRMNQELYRQLFKGDAKPVRIGEAVRQAKAATANPDVRRTWILLGDPTLRLR